MKNPFVVGQERAVPLDKSTGVNNVHSCLRHDVDHDADDSPVTRRKVRSVSFSFPGENGTRPMRRTTSGTHQINKLDKGKPFGTTLNIRFQWIQLKI
jgi:hypothetical protein